MYYIFYIVLYVYIYIYIIFKYFLFIYYFIFITNMIRDMKSAFFPEYQHDCKCNIAFIQQFNKQAVSIKWLTF